MILQSLVAYAEREKVAEDPAFSTVPVAWTIQLDDRGGFVNLANLKTEAPGKGKNIKPRPQRLLIPTRYKRSGKNPSADFLVDKAEFALGINESDPERGKRRQKLFATKVAEAVDATGHSGAKYVAAFLNDPQQVARCVELLQHENWASNDLICFRIGSSYIHDAEPLKEYWRGQFAKEAERSNLVPCLLCGNPSVPARLHPNVKALAGASPSEVPLVSFNQDAFLSYGWEQGDNATTCSACAARYAAALNRFLSNDVGLKQHDRLSNNLTAVYWSDDPSSGIESLVTMILNDPDTIHNLLTKPEHSVGLAQRQLYFHCLLLQGATGRATVRSYVAETIDHVRASILSWVRESNVGLDRPFKRWQLLASLAVQGDASRLPPSVSGELYLSILFGRPIPLLLVQAAVVRNRVLSVVSPARAALLQVWAARREQPDTHKERKPQVSLDPQQPSVGYQLGRLLSVCESVQRSKSGSGLNRTIADRFYPAMSTRPQYVLGSLMKLNQVHLSQLSPQLENYWKTRLQEVLDRIDPASLPPHLSLEEQARFALGYYHQRQHRPPAASEADPQESPQTTRHEENE